MTLSGHGQGSTQDFDAADLALVQDTAQDFDDGDLQLVQAMDDCHKALDTSPISVLAAEEPFVTASRLHETLGSMLATARAERRLRDES